MSVVLLLLCAFSVPSSVGAVSLRASSRFASTNASTATLADDWHLTNCGKLASYGNAKPQNFADAMPTFFNNATKQREPKLYKLGDTINFECVKGFTLDGSMNGGTVFNTTCTGTDIPYFAPTGVCIKASKCGAMPTIPYATATSKVVPGEVEYACNPGYSLDGEKVVAGGMGKNVLFSIKCIEFKGEYEVFKGKCKSYKFMASGPAIAMTTNVFEALFTVNCKGRMVDSFGKFTSGNVSSAPTVDCTKITTADAVVDAKSCSQLVTDITAVFATKKEAFLAAKEGAAKREWFTKNKNDPNVEAESMQFCKRMWTLTQKKMPAASAISR